MTTQVEQLSEGLAAAVAKAAGSVAMVDARRRIPASGIAWSDGVVVTANHVVERDEDITVSFGGEAAIAATVAGRDRGSDIAVLRIAVGTGQPAERAPENSTRVGHLVLAVGRPGEGGVMASMGVVGAAGGAWRTGRGTTVGGYLQADVTMYPGFSGGPLIDVTGRVAGMNSSHLGRGGGLTIPVGALDTIVHDLLAKGRVRRGYLGIGTQTVVLPAAQQAGLADGQESALLITGVETGSPAERAGMLIGDVLVSLAGAVIASTESLFELLGGERIGQTVPAVVLRGGARTELAITLGERE